jgi:hypothetical protein
MKGIRLLLRRRCLLIYSLAATIAVLFGVFAGQLRSAAVAQENRAQSVFDTTVSYVVQFYPLWFTHFQSLFSSKNRLIGPDRISHIYQAVVAINDDTLYASTILTLETEPVILTIPKTSVRYSILSLDLYGNILNTDIPSQTPGIYALTGPGYVGPIPPRATRIDMSLSTSILIFRADKYSSSNQDLTREAEVFRRRLRLQPHSEWKNDRRGGHTLILPELAFALPVKTIADDLIKLAPIKFLQQLQTAIANSDIPPLSPSAQALSDRFDRLFARKDIDREKFKAGARAAHQMILDNYINDNAGRTNWTTFTDIGAWGNNVLNRASITEFCQFCNGRSTAAYYHAFKDDRGRPLDGSAVGGTGSRGYILTFPKRRIPKAERFWSVTAYTPNSVELIKNSARKYVVASYTPKLQYNSNGSISIYMTRKLPVGIPMANWLPIPDGPFNIMLRIYGPDRAAIHNRYIPPAIKRR